MKTFVVTGSSAGIGKEIARGIAKKGHNVILAIRNQEKGKEIIQEFGKDLLLKTVCDLIFSWKVNSGIKKEQLHLFEVDFSNRTSVQKFGKAIRESFNVLHGLVNNAGIAGPQTKQTNSDGYELVWATNVLGYVWTTNELLSLLEKGSPSRIVNVASSWIGDYDLDDFNFDKRPYNPNSAYRQSKLANRMYSWKLAEILKPKGITVNACTPGMVKTKLLISCGFSDGASPEKGAETPLWLILDPSLEGVTGKFFSNKRENECPFRDPSALDALFKKLHEL